MYSLLLAIIYLAFISLGLPDSLLGAAWLVMREEMGVPFSYAGIVAMIISTGTVVTSLLSARTTKRFGTGLVVAVSTLLTALALLGFSLSREFWLLCLFAIPYGLGAGAIDAALNNYVALHYASRHMNWLHCFWGLGATVSPYIMSWCLLGGMGWNSGYRTVFYIQIILTAFLFASLPLWKKQARASGEQEETAVLKMSEILKIKGAKQILIAFFAYCSLEQTAGLWASSYLVLQRGVNVEIAARYASFFFLGITVGRFLCGFIADRFGDRNMIRAGCAVTIAGIILVWLPVAPVWLCQSGLIVIGLGNAPIYPAIIHATPANFGKENSQAIIGVQMASAYLGITLMPPFFGFLADWLSIGLYPLFLLLLAVLMWYMAERVNKATNSNSL
ncbi:MAG: MFS transporter [Lachnospiraceae bacterium]|jgi:fucose permease|nr:MFS transporter [Lachnospiraceae bacterium]